MPEVTYMQVPALKVEAEKSVALEVDGEYCGKTPVHFQVVPKGLEVIIP